MEAFRNAARHLHLGGHFVIENCVPELQLPPLGEPRLVFTATPTAFGDRRRTVGAQQEITQSDFESRLDAHLAAGSFRAVIVLDEAPTELINLVGYLEEQ